MEFLGPRKPLRGDLSVPELAQFTQDFNMYRIVYTKSIGKAAAFAHLEHLCRPLISMQDFMRITKKLQPVLKDKLMTARLASNSGLNPFPALEKSITKKEVKEVGLLDYTVFVQAIGQKYIEIFKAFKHRQPLVNIISYDNIQVLLYNPIATFIDGYESLSGNGFSQNVPLSLIDDLDSSCYYKESKEYKSSRSFECATAYDSFLEVSDLEKQILHKPQEDDDHPDDTENAIFDLPVCQCFEKKYCMIF